MKKSKLHPSLNVRLIRRIQKHILEEPRRFQMDQLAITGTPGTTKWNVFAHDAAKTVPPCGTAACIAGWATLLHYKTLDIDILFNIPFREIAKLLGLTPRLRFEDVFTSTLFYADYWPEPFAAQYAKAKTPKRRAEIAVKRLDYLIETGE